MRMLGRLGVTLCVVAVGGVTVAACGGGGGKPSAEEGRQLALNNGCSSCHGATFTGATGPTWVGLAGSTVTLEGGGTVVADDAYLAEAIRDPSASKVAGYTVAMPDNSLDGEQVDAIVAFIDSLASGG